MLLVILMMKTIFHINYYELIHKCQSFKKLLQMVHQLILSTTQLHKTRQSGGFLGRRFGALLKTWLPLIKNVL